jgi:DNA topoisomerase VI, subunit A
MVRKNTKKETEEFREEMEEETGKETSKTESSDFDDSGFDDYEAEFEASYDDDYTNDYDNETEEVSSYKAAKTESYTGDEAEDEFGSDEDEEFLEPEADLFDASGRLKNKADKDPAPLKKLEAEYADKTSAEYKQKVIDKKIENDNWTTRKLVGLAETFYDQFQNGSVPHVLMPSRTKKNLAYSDESEVWVYGDIESERSAKTVKGAHQLLRTVSVSDFVVSEHLKNSRSSTLRELYYISEGWGAAKFHAQSESDRLIEDLEIITGAQREFFHIRPEEDGATMYGPILIREETKRGSRDIHCQQDIGEGGYQIPFNVENIEFLKHDASMIIAVETGGMYARLIENGFDEKYNAILVHLKGQPARSTRRIIRRMNTELGIPATVFTDGDPWSYRIFSSIAYGAIKSAHLSEYMATPDAKFIGVQPSDIVEYELATDKLSEQDIAALRSELSDPRFESDYWKEQINLQLKIGKKAEQQAFAGKGLDFVTETYLPNRLKDLGII